jgi:hypothetical protein
LKPFSVWPDPKNTSAAGRAAAAADPKATRAPAALDSENGPGAPHRSLLKARQKLKEKEEKLRALMAPMQDVPCALSDNEQDANAGNKQPERDSEVAGEGTTEPAVAEAEVDWGAAAAAAATAEEPVLESLALLRVVLWVLLVVALVQSVLIFQAGCHIIRLFSTDKPDSILMVVCS